MHTISTVEGLDHFPLRVAISSSIERMTDEQVVKRYSLKSKPISAKEIRTKSACVIPEIILLDYFPNTDIVDHLLASLMEIQEDQKSQYHLLHMIHILPFTGDLEADSKLIKQIIQEVKQAEGFHSLPDRPYDFLRDNCLKLHSRDFGDYAAFLRLIQSEVLEERTELEGALGDKEF